MNHEDFRIVFFTREPNSHSKLEVAAQLVWRGGRVSKSEDEAPLRIFLADGCKLITRNLIWSTTSKDAGSMEEKRLKAIPDWMAAQIDTLLPGSARVCRI